MGIVKAKIPKVPKVLAPACGLSIPYVPPNPIVGVGLLLLV